MSYLQLSHLMLMQSHSLWELIEESVVPLLQIHHSLIRLLDYIVTLHIEIVFDSLFKLLYLLLILFDHLLVNNLLLLPLFLNDLNRLLMLHLYLLVHVDNFALHHLYDLLGLLYLLGDCLGLLFEVVKRCIVWGLNLQLRGDLSQVLDMIGLLINFLD